MTAEPLIFAFAGHELVLAADGLPPLAALGPQATLARAIRTGRAHGGGTCYALALEGDELPPGLRSIGLCAVHTELGPDMFVAASRAAQVLTWDREHRFCGACGTPTQRARSRVHVMRNALAVANTG